MMLPFPSIEQFRNVIRTVNERAKHHNVPVPKLWFHGTVKLHGTNAAVARTVGGDLWAQSRTQIITPENDNAGFAAFVAANRAQFVALLDEAESYDRASTGSVVAIYGEWCGGNIQKGVALNQLPKMFVVFAIRIKRGEENSFWFLPSQIRAVFGGCELTNEAIKNIEHFPSWDMDIDFANPALSQNALGEITAAVEAECPAGKALGVSGIGEGVVWRCMGAADGSELALRTDDLVFKVKGEKHSDTKVRTLAPVDIEKVNNVSAFVAQVCTDHRLLKGIDFLREQGAPIDVTSTGQFLKWVGGDVVKEESDTMDASGLDRKDVMGAVNKAARNWLMTYLDQQVMAA